MRYSVILNNIALIYIVSGSASMMNTKPMTSLVCIGCKEYEIVSEITIIEMHCDASSKDFVTTRLLSVHAYS